MGLLVVLTSRRNEIKDLSVWDELEGLEGPAVFSIMYWAHGYGQCHFHIYTESVHTCELSADETPGNFQWQTNSEYKKGF